MISQETIAALEQDERGWLYILGARMRTTERGERRSDVPSRPLPGRAPEAEF